MGSPKTKVRVNRNVGNCTIHLYGLKRRLLPAAQVIGHDTVAKLEMGACATGAGVTVGTAANDALRITLLPHVVGIYKELHPGASFDIAMRGVDHAVVAIVVSTEKEDGTRMSYFGGHCEVQAGQRLHCQGICGEPAPSNILPASIADLPPGALLGELMAHRYLGTCCGFVVGGSL